LETTFAGPPPAPKEVVPAPPPPPVSYFRPNEFDIGAFGTYAINPSGGNTGTRTRFFSFPPFPTQTVTTTVSGNSQLTGWGGGMDFSYYFPWKYLGVRFQGAGLSLTSDTFTVTENLNGVRQASRTGSVSTSAGVLTTDLILRLPLDDFWPSVHVAPYAFGGMGVIFGGGTATINTRFADLNNRFNNAALRSRPLLLPQHYRHGCRYGKNEPGSKEPGEAVPDSRQPSTKFVPFTARESSRPWQLQTLGTIYSQ